MTFIGVRSTDDYRLCCLLDNATVCSIASSTALDSCSRLMPNSILRVALWLIGFVALFGNMMVIAFRCREQKPNRMKVQGNFITNLACADFLTGVYMIIIASVDVYYGDYFFLYAPKWRQSHLCKFSGFIAVLSSEGSVLLLTLISIDRFLGIMFPFGKLRFSSTSAHVCVVFVWILGFIMSLVPLILSSYVSGFYGLSDVCVGLPLNLESKETGILQFSTERRVFEYVPLQSEEQPSWIYSIALYLGLNLLLFVVILICYVIIFIQVKRSARGLTVGRPPEQARQIKLAIRMAFIVGSDFCCWMPVIIMGILSQSGLIVLPPSLYAWCVVFIIPLNSSLNPILYTFIALNGKTKPTISLKTKTESK